MTSRIEEMAVTGMTPNRRSPRGPWLAVLGILSALLAVTAAIPSQAAISVAPATVRLAAPGQTEAIRLTNAGRTAVDVQIRAMAWTHNAEGDQLTPTADVAASPPFVRIEPGATQVVRIGIRGGGATPAYFRLLISEIAAASQPGTVNFAMTVSVPVVVGAPSVREPQLAWSARPAGGRLDVTATGLSPTHATIRDLRITDTSGRSVAAAQVGSSAMVMPGRERRWTALGLSTAAGSRLVLTGTVNGAAFTTTVDVGAP